MYSRNLCTEAKKGKREQAFQGKHNDLPPFGYDKTKEGILVVNEQEEYIQKREELKAQLAELQPIPPHELIEAHRTLEEFPERWEKGNAEERQRLLSMILCRVWVLDDHVCALMLRPCYFVVIHEGIAKASIEDIEPSERPPFPEKENGNFCIMGSCRCGNDGHRFGMWHTSAFPNSSRPSGPGGHTGLPNPASRARMIAWARSVTCSLSKMLEILLRTVLGLSVNRAAISGLL